MFPFCGGRGATGDKAPTLTTDGVTAMETGNMHALIARRGEYKTSHILHLLLLVVCLIVFGGFGIMWIGVWMLCALSNGIERRRIDRQLNRMG